MRVKPAIPGRVIRDPHTKRQLPADGGDVPDNAFWRRRLMAGELELVVDAKPSKPTGREPVAPLTTREGK